MPSELFGAWLDESSASPLVAKIGLAGGSLAALSGGVTIERPVYLRKLAFIGGSSLGYMSYVHEGSHLKNATIGRFCSLAQYVTIGGAEHPTSWLSSHPFQYNGVRYFDDYPEAMEMFTELPFRQSAGLTTIGSDVWIGRNSVIRQGVTIGDGAIVGAGSIVTKNVPPYAVAVGAPARIVRMRFSDNIIERLLSLRWWDYVISKVHAIPFNDIERAVTKLESLKAEGVLSRNTPMKYRIRRHGGRYLIEHV